jgi:hypothetical protein
VVVTSQDDYDGAFRIFRILNDRGMQITIVDKLKSELLSKLCPENRQLWANNWKYMETQYQRELQDTADDTFLQLFENILLPILRAYFDMKKGSTPSEVVSMICKNGFTSWGGTSTPSSASSSSSSTASHTSGLSSVSLEEENVLLFLAEYFIPCSTAYLWIKTRLYSGPTEEEEVEEEEKDLTTPHFSTDPRVKPPPLFYAPWISLLRLCPAKYYQTMSNEVLPVLVAFLRVRQLRKDLSSETTFQFFKKTLLYSMLPFFGVEMDKDRRKTWLNNLLQVLNHENEENLRDLLETRLDKKDVDALTKEMSRQQKLSHSKSSKARKSILFFFLLREVDQLLRIQPLPEEKIKRLITTINDASSSEAELALMKKRVTLTKISEACTYIESTKVTVNGCLTIGDFVIVGKPLVRRKPCKIKLKDCFDHWQKAIDDYGWELSSSLDVRSKFEGKGKKIRDKEVADIIKERTQETIRIISQDLGSSNTSSASRPKRSGGRILSSTAFKKSR